MKHSTPILLLIICSLVPFASTIEAATCGNGVIEVTEECEPPGTPGCSLLCTIDELRTTSDGIFLDDLFFDRQTGEVTLSWTGWQESYQVYASGDPTQVVAAENQLGTTSERSFVHGSGGGGGMGGFTPGDWIVSRGGVGILASGSNSFIELFPAEDGSFDQKLDLGDGRIFRQARCRFPQTCRLTLITYPDGTTDEVVLPAGMNPFDIAAGQGDQFFVLNGETGGYSVHAWNGAAVTELVPFRSGNALSIDYHASCGEVVVGDNQGDVPTIQLFDSATGNHHATIVLDTVDGLLKDVDVAPGDDGPCVVHGLVSGATQDVVLVRYELPAGLKSGQGAEMIDATIQTASTGLTGQNAAGVSAMDATSGIVGYTDSGGENFRAGARKYQQKDGSESLFEEDTVAAIGRGSIVPGNSTPPETLTYYNINAVWEPSPWSAIWWRTHDEQESACEVCRDCPPDSEPASPMVGDVFAHSGEVAVTVDPFGISGRGDEHWGMAMTYRNQIDFLSCAGTNWNLEYATDGIVPSGEGGFDRYDPVPARMDHFDGTGDRSAEGLSESWDFILLNSSKAGAGLSQPIEVRRRDGYTRTYLPLDGQVTSGRLGAIEDRNGNRLEFGYNAFGQLIQAIDSMGRSILYEYDSRGRIARILDFHRRSTIFQFDDFDNLISITTPAIRGTPHDDDGIPFNGGGGNDFPNGKTRRFRYDSGNPDPILRNNLLGITYPDEVATGGPERITFLYGTDPGDSTTYDRVIRMEIGGGRTKIDPVGSAAIDLPAGGTYTFAYEDLAARVAGDLVTEIRKTTVTDPNGNVTEYFFNSSFHEVRRVVHTNRNIHSEDPATFTTTKTWAADCLLTEVTYPEGNRKIVEYDVDNPNRFSQRNALKITEVADPQRGGDQLQLETSFTYDPIYNQVLTITGPRGNDPTYVPALPDDPTRVHPVDFNLDGDLNDPDDGETTRRYRYTLARTLDYMELSPAQIEALAAEERVNLDPDGAGPRTAAEVAQALSLSFDLNGDGRTDQAGGNVIEVRAPTVQLVGPGGIASQQVLNTMTYNDLGQITSSADPEGNLTSYYYFPELDPDGDGFSEGLVRPGVDAVTGGYQRLVVRDDDPSQASNAGGDSLRPAGQPITNAGTARRTRSAAFAEVAMSFDWDRVGNRVRMTDGRGIETRYRVNEMNQVVQVTRAAAHHPALQDPSEPQALTDFQYLERRFYDFNDNLIRHQLEDRGDTSSVGADNGDSPFVDTVFKFDLLDRLIERRQEVDNAEVLITRYRLDPNGNFTLVIHPEGNADAFVYDERNLLFRQVRGAAAPPALTLLGAADPTDYRVRGGVASTNSFSYNGNGRLLEIGDAADTDGSPANNSILAGAGDRTRHLYDGHDRMTGIIDSVGNQAVAQFDPAGNVIRISRFGPDGGPSPTADGPDDPSLPVSVAGTIQSGNLVSTNLLSSTEYVHDELSRVFQVDRVLFANTVVSADLQDGAIDIGKDDLTPGDDHSVPGVSGVDIVGRVSERFERDRNSEPIAVVEDDGDRQTNEYDGLDRMVTRIDAEANRLALAYDDNHNVIEVQETDVAQLPGIPDEVLLTTYFYDALDRLQQRVDNVGQSTSYRYDSRNNLVATADANGPVTGAGITRRQFPLGALTLDTINDFGNVTLLSYDGINRRTVEQTVLTASGGGDGISIGVNLFGIPTTPPTPDAGQAGGDGMITIRREWDRNSLISSVVDDNGNRTRYGFDDLNRLITRTRGECSAPGLADQCDPPTTMTWEYDRDDNVSVVTDENGSVITCDHDAINRQTGCDIAPGAGVIGTTATSFEFDGLGRLVRGNDNNVPADLEDDSEIRVDYDSLGRVIRERQRIGSLPERVVSSSWRAENLRSGLLYPNGRSLSFSFDGLDRLRTVGDTGGDSAIAEYDYLGPTRVLQRSYPQNGTRMTFLDNAGTSVVGYDGVRRSVRLRHLDASDSLIVGFDYGYDRMRHRLSQAKLHDPANSEVYDYDSAYRLLSFDRPSGSALSPQQSSWILDGVGNWKQVDSEIRRHTSFNEILDRTGGGLP